MSRITYDVARRKSRAFARAAELDATLAEIDAEFDECAAIYEFDGGLSRHEAEAQARADIYDTIINGGGTYPGMLGELVIAARRRFLPAFVDTLQTLGIATSRAPLWGIGHIVSEGDGYRPADLEEFAHPAFIVPAFEHAGLVDLVAETLVPYSRYTRLGCAGVLNFDAIDNARDTGEPLFLFENVRQWLRGGCHGAVVIDWRRAAREFDGVRAILCAGSLAPSAYRWTRRCWPQPTIAVPSPKEVGRAG